eukprot:6473324-Amphidinium_carterae.2
MAASDEAHTPKVCLMRTAMKLTQSRQQEWCCFTWLHHCSNAGHRIGSHLHLILPLPEGTLLRAENVVTRACPGTMYTVPHQLDLSL